MEIGWYTYPTVVKVMSEVVTRTFLLVNKLHGFVSVGECLICVPCLHRVHHAHLGKERREGRRKKWRGREEEGDRGKGREEGREEGRREE